MTKPTIEEMVEWFGELRCDSEPPRMFDIDSGNGRAYPRPHSRPAKQHAAAG